LIRGSLGDGGLRFAGKGWLSGRDKFQMRRDGGVGAGTCFGSGCWEGRLKALAGRGPPGRTENETEPHDGEPDRCWGARVLTEQGIVFQFRGFARQAVGGRRRPKTAGHS